MKLFKSEKQIIAEIHHEFDSAQDNLLKQAESIISKSYLPEKSGIEELAERLKNAGFVKAPIVSKAELEKDERQKTERLIVKNIEQAQIINYYKRTYPFLKFITENELNRICEKYNLIHAPVGNYIKEVPEKNLRDIERAQPVLISDKVKNKCILKITEFWHQVPDKVKEFLKDGIEMSEEYIEKDFYRERWLKTQIKDAGIELKVNYIYRKADVETIKKQDILFIAAPQSHFDLKNLKKKSKYGFFNVEIKKINDPIVFRYVKGGVQILTMWGLEANDPLLVNPINN